MATPRSGLCLILTLWIASSRPSAAIRSGSPDTKAWWESGEFSLIHQKAAEYRQKNDLAGWESAYQEGYDEAKRQGIAAAQISYLSSLGSIRMLRFHYAEALDAYLAGQKLAESTGDWLNAGGIAVNLTSLYAQVSDLPSALAAAEEGRAAVAHVPSAYYKPQLLLQSGRLLAIQGDSRAVSLYLAGIEAAREQAGVTLVTLGQTLSGSALAEAQGWDLLGSFYLSQGRWDAAEHAITEAFLLRKFEAPEGLPASYASLGALKLAQGRTNSKVLPAAERFTAQAIQAAQNGTGSTPLHLLLEQRGRIHQARGQMGPALEDFRAAVDAAMLWRRGVLAAGSALTSSNMELRGVFDSFVETAAHQALGSGDAELASESFLVNEMNRAASLRETQALSPVWRKKLPDLYWETLSKLRVEQTRSLRAGVLANTLEKSLRLKLTEMEAVAGLGFFSNVPENFKAQNSLIHFRSRFKDDEVLLSFHLGSVESYLWAVTKQSLRMYRLGPEELIRSEVAAFQHAVAANSREAVQAGERLYASLFGQLVTEQSAKKLWLLSLEDSLFEAPFAALVQEQIGGKVIYLIEKHSIQVVPGAFSLELAAPRARSRMVAVGDPIYNEADPRQTLGFRGRSSSTGWASPHWWSLTNGLAVPNWRPPPSDTGFELNRLPGSGAEIRESAKAWGDSTILEGAGARRGAFLVALATQPAVIHLATHVLADPHRRDQAFVAFGIGADSQPELLTPAEIASLRVPESLVVMTGCSTGVGESAGAAGLLGLSRAWMVAGATGVVATAWPVADGGGSLTGSLPAGFYRHLKSAGTAQALREAQLDMLHSGTWQAAPVHWAGYQLTGGAR